VTDRQGLRPTGARRPGFTLLELVIVVVILAVVGAIAVPRVGESVVRSKRRAFAADLHVYTSACQQFRIERGDYPADGGSGELPDGLADYIEPHKWLDGTPLGGVWDTEKAESGITFAVGVHFYSRTGAANARGSRDMAELDAEIDDGGLKTGKFRNIRSDGYYWVVEE